MIFICWDDFPLVIHLLTCLPKFSFDRLHNVLMVVNTMRNIMHMMQQNLSKAVMLVANG